MYVCMYVYIYIHVYGCIWAFVLHDRICIGLSYIYIYRYTHMCMGICFIYRFVCLFVYLSVWWRYLDIYIYMHTYTSRWLDFIHHLGLSEHGRIVQMAWFFWFLVAESMIKNWIQWGIKFSDKLFNKLMFWGLYHVYWLVAIFVAWFQSLTADITILFLE